MIACFLRAKDMVKLDYPYHACIVNALKDCAELCIVVGKSEDETRDIIYSYQDFFGRDRIRIKEDALEFNLGWQERWWDICREMTKCPWHMWLDLDEMLYWPGTLEGILKEGLLQMPAGVLVRFPFVHFYGTPDWKLKDGIWLTHNTRLGLASAGFRMRNWRSAKMPDAPACQIVYRSETGREIDAHGASKKVTFDYANTILHYGWVRNHSALQEAQRRQGRWYGEEKERAPDNPLDGRLFREGKLELYTRDHSMELESWFDMHEKVWLQIEEAWRE